MNTPLSAEALSPLADIERRVLERAKQDTLDLSDESAGHRLRGLVEDEVAQWSLDFKHGQRPFDLPSPDLVVDRAWRNLAGYGPLEPLLADDDVWEIMINAPDQIFVKRHLGVSGYHDEAFHDDDHVVRTLTKVLDDASTSHRKLDASEGLQDAQLDSGARLHIAHRDIGRDGHLLVNIRKFTGVAFRSLDQLVDRGMLTQQVAHFLRAAVHARRTIVFAGPPGSGKTTMLSCCAAARRLRSNVHPLCAVRQQPSPPALALLGSGGGGGGEQPALGTTARSCDKMTSIDSTKRRSISSADRRSRILSSQTRFFSRLQRLQRAGAHCGRSEGKGPVAPTAAAHGSRTGRPTIATGSAAATAPANAEGCTSEPV